MTVIISNGVGSDGPCGETIHMGKGTRRIRSERISPHNGNKWVAQKGVGSDSVRWVVGNVAINRASKPYLGRMYCRVYGKLAHSPLADRLALKQHTIRRLNT